MNNEDTRENLSGLQSHAEWVWYEEQKEVTKEQWQDYTRRLLDGFEIIGRVIENEHQILKDMQNG